jgi:hypothetical protein
VSALIWATARELLFGGRALILLLSPLISAAFVAAMEMATGTGAGLPSDLATLALTWCRELAPPTAVILGAGVIAGPLRSGEMVLWAVRPITLSAILVARVAGTWLATMTVLLLPWGLSLPLAQGSIPTAELVAAPLRAALASAAVLAPLALLSVLLPLAGDALAYVGLLIGLALARENVSGIAHRVLDELARFLFPSTGFVDELLTSGRCSLEDPLRWAALLSLALLVSCILLSRRELHYARSE